MKKLKPPKGYRMLRENEVLKLGDGYMNKFGGLQYSNPFVGMMAKSAGCYGINYAYFRRIPKPKKSRTKKSLGQIAYDTYRLGVGYDWQLQSGCVRKDWKAVADAVAREVRRRMANK